MDEKRPDTRPTVAPLLGRDWRPEKREWYFHACRACGVVVQDARPAGFCERCGGDLDTRRFIWTSESVVWKPWTWGWGRWRQIDDAAMIR